MTTKAKEIHEWWMEAVVRQPKVICLLDDKEYSDCDFMHDHDCKHWTRCLCAYAKQDYDGCTYMNQRICKHWKKCNRRFEAGKMTVYGEKLKPKFL